MPRAAAADHRSYDDRVRSCVLEQDTETLDFYRRLGERKPDEIALGGMTGRELADLCDDEIAARYVTGVA